MATEKRLIDANRVLRDPYFQEGRYPESHLLRMAIREQPTVDAAEVVRCKDCKHYRQYHVGKTNDLCEWGKCNLIHMDVDMPENGYCCFGERGTDNVE